VRAIPACATRDRALFTLLYETGMRVGEALSVQRADVDLTPDDEKVRVLGKGGRERTVLLTDGGSKWSVLCSSSARRRRPKGTYRYQEVEVADRDTAVGSLYLKKAVVGDAPPAQLRVTIEANPGTAV
jgi:Phage integrase family